MNFWLMSSFSYCLMIPSQTPSFQSESKEELLTKGSDDAALGLETTKLNIDRDDLLRAGYHHKRNSWT